MVIGLLAITAIPVVTGVAQGFSAQKQKQKEREDAKRMLKFHLDVYCEAESSQTKQVRGKRLVLRDGKLWIDDPVPEHRVKPAYTVKAFYIEYPDENRDVTLGLVSQVADDPPLLNWIYVDTNTLEVKHGNRSQSIAHHIGPWDWTKDEAGLTINGWEGLVAVEENVGEWALYYDHYDDMLEGRVGEKKVLQISLERTMAKEDG